VGSATKRQTKRGKNKVDEEGAPASYAVGIDKNLRERIKTSICSRG